MAKQEKSAAELYREERKARLAKAAKQNSKKSHGAGVSTKIVGIICALIAVVVVGAVGFSVVKSTGVLERNKVAFTVGDTDISMAEYTYYYNAAYSETLNNVYSIEQQMPGYGSQLYGYDMYKMPDEQEYTQEEIEGVENPTWADFFDHRAKEQIKYAQSSLAYAAENKIALEDEDYHEIEHTLEEWEAQAAQASAQSNATYSLTAYLQANYGKAMNESEFRKIIEKQVLVQKVQETKNEEIKATFKDKDVDKAYNEALSTYGAVSYRSYEFAAEMIATKNEAGEESSAPTDATMAAAKAEAEAFAAKLTDEESFKKAAHEDAKAKKNEEADKILSEDSTLNKDATSMDIVITDQKATEWIFSKETKNGDIFIAEEEGTGYVVLYMVDPVHKAPDATESYDVRHILVKFPEEEKTESDAKEEVKAKEIDLKKYEDAVIVNDYNKKEITDVEALNKAVDILTEYLDGDRTADAFGELAKEYSEDSNAEQGGLYEHVPMGQMVPSFEGWSADLARKEGDVGIVETNYGYHIMYFVKSEIKNTDDTIRNDLAAEKLNEFVTELSEKEGFDFTNIDAGVAEEVRKIVMKIAKQNVDYFGSMASYGY